MINKIVSVMKKTRAKMTKTLFPKNSYWLAPSNLKPISDKFGYDRGTPIDRYWIEDFLSKNKSCIKGVCLEVTDDYYLNKFGTAVETKIILDIDKNNKKANLFGDLRNLKGLIQDNSVDCIVLTHVLGLIDDIDSAIAECYRVLKKNGVILATSSCLSPTYDPSSNFWRFTPNGARFLFTKKFDEKQTEISSYGNVKTGQCFWVGMAQEELTEEELKYNDPKFPCIVAIKATK